MNDPNLMILAGGVSSRMKRSIESRTDLDPRLKSEAQSKSKSMITVGQGGRPFLDYLLYNAREAGYEEVLIIVSDKDTSIRDYYGKKQTGNGFHGLRISYAVQNIPQGRSKPLGTADAVLQGLNARTDWVGKQFTVCNSDNLYSRKAFSILLESSYPNAMIDYDRDALGFEESRVHKFAVTHKDKDGFLTAILEKPDNKEIEFAKGESGRIGVSMNIFRFSHDDIHPYLIEVPLHPVREEKELPSAITMMIKDHPQSVFAYPLSERVPDMTSLLDFESVKDYVSAEFKDFKW